jgi:hypothetical protein
MWFREFCTYAIFIIRREKTTSRFQKITMSFFALPVGYPNGVAPVLPHGSVSVRLIGRVLGWKPEGEFRGWEPRCYRDLCLTATN